MRILIQRVKNAKVTVDDQDVGEIRYGLLLFVGIGKDDSVNDIDYMANKVKNLRIFEDKEGKMNLTLKQINGQLLSVPQFTLYANTSKGNRPGFDLSAKPETAKRYWSRFNDLLREDGLDVKEGIFGAHMDVALINDGPVTIWLDSKTR